jgi:lipoprotein-releasing system permease protein
MAVMNGFRIELMAKVLGFSGHGVVYSNTASPILDYDAISTRLKKSPGIQHAIPYVQGDVLASSRANNTGARIMGMREADIQSLTSIRNENLLGSLKGFDNSQGVAVGYKLARNHRLQLGDNITLVSPEGPDTIFGTAPRFRDYPIVAIFNMGMSEYDQSIIYMPLAEAQEYLDLGEGVSAIQLVVDVPEKIDEYLGNLQTSENAHLLFTSWKFTNKTFFDALIVERNVMFLILTLIILVAALNIISGLIMLVKDKSKDIAILRTMGASRASVQRIFFMTGAAIGISGTIAGIVLGIVFCLNIESIRRWLESITGNELFPDTLYFLAHLPAKLDFWEIVGISLMSLTLSFIATLYPSWRAARLDPVEALRYE